MYPPGTLLPLEGGAVNDEAGAATVRWDRRRQTGMPAHPSHQDIRMNFSVCSYSCVGFLPISSCGREGTQLPEVQAQILTAQ